MRTRTWRAASIIVFAGLCAGASLDAQHVLRTSRLKMGLNARGEIVRLADAKDGRDHAPAGEPGYLVRVKSGGRELRPTGMTAGTGVLTFVFDRGIRLRVRASEKAEYIRFELTEAAPAGTIEAVLWGPIKTTIAATIGEVVGVVRNADFAVGLQTLNAKTCGGKLVNDEGTTGGRTTAGAEPFGASLQAFTVNQARDRILTVWPQHRNVPVKALPGFKLEGSALAVFGTAPADVLPLIGRIEIAEGLPHPMIDGAWAKTSTVPGRPYLIANFSEATIDAMLAYARRLGFATLYHGGPFKTWGHFDLLEGLFPNGRAGFKRCVDKARAMGIRVGCHTLTNFITTNDSFVTTAANRGLMAAGVARLGKDVDAATTAIVVDREDYFAQESTLNSVIIGTEIVRYRDVSGTGPFTLTDCVRGAFGTAAAAHAEGDEARKLMDHPYKTLFPDWPMQEDLIRNLAGFFNETGTAQMDFDGHEGACYLGRGDYGHVHFVEAFLGRVDHSVLNGSSNVGHFYWHFNSYINWGEPWYASFRESQSRYRFELQPFYERNYMPNMLGWFLMTPDTRLEDIEWMLARAAGYRAGYAFVAEYETFQKNPAADAIIEAVRTWEEAKRLGVFSDEQRARLKDPERDFRLERAGEGRWTLQSFDKIRFEHRKKILQPGQPTGSAWAFDNAFDPQPLHLHLLLEGGVDAEARGIEIEVDRFFKAAVPGILKKGQSLVWDGSESLLLYGDKGRLLERIDLGRALPLLSTGRHTVTVEAGLAGSGEPVLRGAIKLKTTSEALCGTETPSHLHQ
ncbi:MAG: hypothetical protein JW742_02570 [Candidatus Aminicenantes bacterium]|nr:hypothetical protein [Candidatus Aminicenantes bacterium]